jgi:glutamine synthetase
LSPEKAKTLPHLCSTLEEALGALKQDYEFLLEGDVFSKDIIDSYIQIKEEEVTQLKMTTHPVELDMYYSL